MTQAHKTPGAIVELKEKMYEAPYAPWYDEHKGETFEVLDGNHAPGHVLVRSLRDGVEVALHDDEIKTVPKK